MNTQSLVREELDRPRTRTAFETAFRSVRLLIGGYVAISAAYIVFVCVVTAALARVSGETLAPSPQTIETGTRSKRRRGRARESTK